MSDASGQTAWSYDKMGRVVTEERTIGSVTKTLSYSYFFDGSLASVTYPSGRTVTYADSAVGRPVSAEDLVNNINYATSATYAPQGALASANYGASITFSAAYNNRLLPNDLKGKTSSTFFELQPSYYANNNVNVVTNAVTSGRTQTFTYDNLNRIVTAKSTATSGTYCWGQSIPTDGTGYDRYGNLLKINTSQCSSPALNVSVNTYNQITNSGYTYDASGDMLTDGTNTYTWSGEGQLKSAASVNYTYDGDMKRVEKSSGTYYWFSPGGMPLAETDASGNTQNEYIYFSAGRTARRDSAGNVYYYFSDAIGTAQLITNSTGAVCYDSNKTPFGYEMAYTTTCAQNYMFAGMERDSETGNDHTWFRNYEQNLGRWMSPDLVGGDVTNPQSLNRYTYALNNPTTLIDPLGLCDEPDTWNVTLVTVTNADGSSYQYTLSTLVSGIPCDDNYWPVVSAPLGGPLDWYASAPMNAPGPPLDPTKQAAQQAATKYCQDHGQIAFNIPFTSIPVTIATSGTLGPVNYSTTNDISPVVPLIPWPEWLSAGVSFVDITVNAPATPSPSVSVGVGKNDSVGTYLTPHGPQGLTLSIAPVSIGPPVVLTLPPGNGCGMYADRNSGR